MIIEEASLLSASFFDTVEEVVRSIKSSTEFFGGILVILISDFYQLPPVKGDFVFQANCWNAGKFIVKRLTNVSYRQKDDHFRSMLNEIREGKVSDETSDALSSLKSADEYSAVELDEFIKIFSLKKKVDAVNDVCLHRIESPIIELDAVDEPQHKGKANLLKQEADSVIPSKISIKVGCRVMLVKNINISEKLVNGTVGIVLKYEYPYVHVKVCNLTHLIGPEEWDFEDLGRRKQYPIVLSYALTIHKCQGMSLPKLYVDLQHAFAHGQVYVALSRAVSLNSLIVENFDKSKVNAHPKVIEFYNAIT